MSVSLVTGFAGESHITSEQIARFNASVFGSGEYVATGAGKTISASLQSANTVRVMPGDIMMKGRHIVVDSAQDLSIENGSQALKRNDLIVCRYEKNSSTGMETASLDVIKGTPGEIAVDPNYVSGDLLNGGALINEMPLFRISLDGLAVQEPVPLFSKYLLRGDQIADNAITTEKIANGTITASDLSSDLAGRITDLEAAWDSVSRISEIELTQGIKCYKRGHDVLIRFDKSGISLPAGGFTKVATLPGGVRPAIGALYSTVNGGSSSGAMVCVRLYVGADGTVSAHPGITAANSIVGCVGFWTA